SGWASQPPRRLRPWAGPRPLGTAAAPGRGGGGPPMRRFPAGGPGPRAVGGVPAGALLILTRGLLDGLWMPMVNVYLNRLVASRLRATTLSLQSVLARLTLAVTLAMLGVLTARLGLASTLASVAAAIALVGGWLLAFAPRSVRRQGVSWASDARTRAARRPRRQPRTILTTPPPR